MMGNICERWEILMGKVMYTNLYLMGKYVKLWQSKYGASCLDITPNGSELRSGLRMKLIIYIFRNTSVAIWL